MRKKPASQNEPRLQENRLLRGVLTALFVVAGIALGIVIGTGYINLITQQPEWFQPWQAGAPPSRTVQIWTYLGVVVASGLLGFLISSYVFIQVLKIRQAVETMSAREKVALFVGLVVGLVLTFLITVNFRMPGWMTVGLAILLCYLAIAATMSAKEQLRFYYPVQSTEETDYPRQQPKILDTNVIIDGRILDVCRTGFVEGSVYIPRFILDELQHIADSSDSLKRTRGRRGLDILNQMRKDLGMKITTYDPDGIKLPHEVDSKLVAVAQHLDAAIITNDFNLNKVAELQGVTVLNLNELANSLKPVVLPGEQMSVTIIREGKEQNQGVAYLDDGTMVVVENAAQLIGERLDVEVASVLQTVAGKMIFAGIRDDQAESDSSQAARAGSRSRRR